MSAGGVAPAISSAAVASVPHSLAARAYLKIRNQILKGELPVGMALARRKLAAALNISVPPVSEALQRLEREGLVECKPRVGTRVRVPTRRDIEDRSLVREALETQAARLFAERATPAEKRNCAGWDGALTGFTPLARKVPTGTFYFR